MRAESKSYHPKPTIRQAILVGAILFFSPTLFAFDVTGTVVDSKNQPVAGADVWLSQNRNVKHTQTDARGAFAFAEVLPTPADIVARKEGFSLGGTVVSIIGSGSVTVPLYEAGVVRLRIKNESHEPLEGAYVRAMFVADSFNVLVEDLVAQGFPPIRSDEQGQMTIPALPKGTHIRFVAGHRDYADAAVAYLPVDGKEQTIVLYPGVKLRGRVTCDGKGIAHARVVVSRIGTGAQRDAAETLTDPEGFYNVTVEPGEYFVNVRHPEYASPRAQHALVELEAEHNLADLSLERPRAIEGSVVYPDGKPCSGMQVSYWIGSDLYIESITQADGHFRMLTPQVDGRIRLFPPNGYMTESLGDIQVTGTAQPEIRLAPIKLAALPSVEGAIVDAEGKPQPGVLVSSRGLVPPMWLIADANGKFKIQLPQAPPEGKASFRAEHGERFLRGDFEVSFVDPKPITVRLAPFEPDDARREVKKGENDLSAMVGAKAPEIACDHWFNSTPLTLESLRGKVVVLAFWSAFNLRGPIVDFIEELRALRDLLKDADDVALVCIHDNGQEVSDIQQIIDRCGITFPVGRDTETFKTYQAYGIHYIPQIVLIDKKGVLRFFEIEGRLLELLKSLRREG